MLLLASDGLTEETQSFNIDVLTGTGEFNLVMPGIRPNPFQDKIIIENGSGFDMTILSSSGIPVIIDDIPDDIFEVDLSQLSPGIYFCRLTTGNESITRKIIKVE